jgi:hypothetical protein
LHILKKNSASVAPAILLLVLVGVIISYVHHHYPRLSYTDEAGEMACIDYDEGENTITINCNASFSDVIQTTDNSDILEQIGSGEYILKANLEVADDITFAMTSAADGLQYLKLSGENGILVYGQILIDGVKITS